MTTSTSVLNQEEEVETWVSRWWVMPEVINDISTLSCSTCCLLYDANSAHQPTTGGEIIKVIANVKVSTINLLVKSLLDTNLLHFHLNAFIYIIVFFLFHTDNDSHGAHRAFLFCTSPQWPEKTQPRILSHAYANKSNWKPLCYTVAPTLQFKREKEFRVSEHQKHSEKVSTQKHLLKNQVLEFLTIIFILTSKKLKLLYHSVNMCYASSITTMLLLPDANKVKSLAHITVTWLERIKLNLCK